MRGLAWAWGGNFNSHAHVERDPISSVLRLIHKYFNSHAHVERDVYNFENSLILIDDFNSHAHVERDL